MIPPIADQFIAGETEDEVLAYARSLGGDGIGAIINLLGEHYTDPTAAAADRDRYLDLLQQLPALSPTGSMSVKPSQIGLEVDSETFRENLTAIADAAADAGVFLWVDMEDHTTVDQTLSAVHDVAETHGGGIGVCLQANLKRTRQDLIELADTPAAVRLVKGAYDEPAAIAYQSQSTIDRVYKDLIETAFERFDTLVAVGSHDPTILEHAAQLHADYDTPYEVQMLMGVRESAQRSLAASGTTVKQYVPYGSQWPSYFYRRVRERKENLLFAARAVAGDLRS